MSGSAPLFRSFFLGGFEASTMRRADGRRNDLVAATRHDSFAEEDYRRLQAVGIATVRDGTAWHRIEERRGEYDWSSVVGRVRAAQRLGVQVIWDLCHFGWPDDVDPFAPDFADRLARFAGAFARLLRAESTDVPWYAPVNEPSFVAWAAGDVGYLNPFGHGRGTELKRRLVQAAIAAAAAVRDVDPRARICHLDPIIHIEPNPAHPDSDDAVRAHEAGQFEAWDMLAGRRDEELGGSEAELDVLGVNYYDRNQWLHGGPTLAIGDPGFRPLRDLLEAVHRRYRRPLFIAETGTEGDGRAAWLRYVSEEVAGARERGIPVAGICLYPVVDHPGWDDDRALPVGLWGYPNDAGERPPYQPLIDELRLQQARFAPAAAPAPSEPASRAVPGAPRQTERTIGRRPVICLVTESREPSGMGRQLLTLAQGLAGRHRVIVAAPAAIDARWLLDAAATAGIETWPLVDGHPLAQAADLRRRMLEIPVELLNVHAGIGWEGHAAVAAGRAAGAAVIRTEHLPYLLTKPREQAAFAAALADVDRIIAVSAAVATSHVAAGVPAHLVRTVRNGIADPCPIPPRRGVRQALDVPDEAPLIVSVGRLTPQKGYDVLLAAAARVVERLPDARLVLVGSGPLAASIRTLLDQSGLAANARLLDRWGDVPALLGAADVVALASRFEGLPLVALEAMAVGVPVVATRVAGLAEVVVEGITGRLVGPEDPVALAEALLEGVTDRHASRAWGDAGRARYEEEFRAERMVAETAAVYAELLLPARARAEGRLSRAGGTAARARAETGLSSGIAATP